MRGILDKYYFQKSLYKKKSKLAKSGDFNVRCVDFPVPGNIDIYKDRVLIVSWSGSMIAVLIHSQEIADGFRNYFESVWKTTIA